MIMAVMILGIALGACVMSFSLAMRSVNTAANQMTALHYARIQIEALRTNHFSATALNPGTYAISNANFTGTCVISNVDTWTKNISMSVPYRKRVRSGYSTNILVTSFGLTLHP